MDEPSWWKRAGGNQIRRLGRRAGAPVARRNGWGTTAEDLCARLSPSTDLLPDGVVNGFNRWLVVRSWSDEAHAGIISLGAAAPPSASWEGRKCSVH